ncbi:hypothetical protein Tco_1313835, partial [Tanacetum coccineum]
GKREELLDRSLSEEIQQDVFVDSLWRLYIQFEEQIVVEDKDLDELWMCKHLNMVLTDKKLQEVWIDKKLSNVVWDELIHIEETKMVKMVVETMDCCMNTDKF